MRKLLFVLATMFASISQAQEVINLTKQLKCSDAQFVINEFTQKWGESPVWVAKTDNGGTNILLLVNREKKTWTLLEYNVKIACVLGVGQGGSPPDLGV